MRSLLCNRDDDDDDDGDDDDGGDDGDNGDDGDEDDDGDDHTSLLTSYTSNSYVATVCKNSHP